jgi:hypothetical protein
VKQFQATLLKLKSVFEETLIPEELQSLSEEVDLKRLIQIYARISSSPGYVSPEELENLGKELLTIWENEQLTPNGNVCSSLSKAIVFIATKALSFYPSPTFKRLQNINLDHFFEKLKKKPELFTRTDHHLALETVLHIYKTSDEELGPDLSEKIVFIGNHLLLTSENPDLRAIVDKLSPKLLRGPNLVLSGERGSDTNFDHIHRFLLTSRPDSVKETEKLTEEFISYWKSHQFGVTIKQAVKMHTVAHVLNSIWGHPELEAILLKIKSSLTEYEQELSEEIARIQGLPIPKFQPPLERAKPPEDPDSIKPFDGS